MAAELEAAAGASSSLMHGTCTARKSKYISSLPDHLIDVLSGYVAHGARLNFKLTCRAFYHASRRQTSVLDLYEMCGWGRSSHQPPDKALSATSQYRNVTHVILPNGWREHSIQSLLTFAATKAKTWKQLSSITLHFQALCPSTVSAIVNFAPSVTQLVLSLDLAYERTSRQAWRMSSLLQLKQLRSLVVSADLTTESLQVLSGLSRLRQLHLVGHSHLHRPAAALAALTGLTQLTNLSLRWHAGRTLRDAQLLSSFSNLKDLQIWISSQSGLPPCSSKPLSGLMEAVGKLSGLTSLQLLQGLHMSWDLRTISQLSMLTQLQVLGLHDSVLSEHQLGLLAPCVALTALKVDAIKLHTVSHNSAAAAAAAVAADGAEPAAGLADATVVAEPLASASAHAGTISANSSAASLYLCSMRRLQHLEVNMLQLGPWQLNELCPNLITLTPLQSTLGPKGHGVVWDLGSIYGHAQLQNLGLMIGSLGSAISCRKSYKRSRCQDSMAVAVVRMLFKSVGIGRMSIAAPAGCTVQQVVQIVGSLPHLQELQLWGHAGSPSGRLLDSMQHRCCSLSNGCLTAVHSGNVDVSPSVFRSTAAMVSRSSRGGTAAEVAGSISAAIGNLVASLGCLIATRGMSHLLHYGRRAAAGAGHNLRTLIARPAGSNMQLQAHRARIWSAGSLVNGNTTGVHNRVSQLQRQSPPAGQQEIMGGNIPPCSGTTCGRMHHEDRALSAGSCCCHHCCRSPADRKLLLHVLQGLPLLQLVSFVRCEHLPECGLQLAARYCSRVHGTAVAVAQREGLSYL